MATFDPIYDLTGSIEGVFEQGHNAGTDGIDFYYWDFNTGLYKYDVSSNTDSLVVDRDDLVSGYGNWNVRATKIASFNQEIYIGQMIDTTAPTPSDRGGRIWKYTPETDTLSAVFQRDTGTYNNAWLYADDDHLFFHIAGTNSPAVDHEGWYSTNGASWAQATYGSDPTRLFSTFTCYSDMRAGGIHFLSSNRLYRSNSNGTVSVLQDPYALGGSFTDFAVGQTTYFSDVGEMVVTTQPEYITVQWTADATASAQGAVLKDLNMPETLLQNSTTAIYQWNGTNDFAAFDTISTGMVISNGHFGWVWRANSGEVFLFGQRSTGDWWVWQRDEDLAATPNAWGAGKPSDPSGLSRPASVDADGNFIYIALLTSTGTPFLLKQETTLTSNSEVVFDPASGTDIGVQCGRFDSSVVWVAGDFGSPNIVYKSEDSGTTFDTKNPATQDPITGFTIGPDSDDRVLIVDDNSVIQETEDSGAIWIVKNLATGEPTINTIARLDINIEEAVFGGDAGNISYSPNSGENLEDISSGFASDALYTDTNITKVIVN